VSTATKGSPARLLQNAANSAVVVIGFIRC
jgi:hypothetical protein